MLQGDASGAAGKAAGHTRDRRQKKYHRHWICIQWRDASCRSVLFMLFSHVCAEFTHNAANIACSKPSFMYATEHHGVLYSASAVELQ